MCVPGADHSFRLLGSWGCTHPNSDIDLLIVESEPFGKHRSRRRELGRLWMALSPVPVAKDLLVYDHEEFEQRRHRLNHIVARALREGKVEYAQS